MEFLWVSWTKYHKWSAELFIRAVSELYKAKLRHLSLVVSVIVCSTQTQQFSPCLFSLLISSHSLNTYARSEVVYPVLSYLPHNVTLPGFSGLVLLSPSIFRCKAQKTGSTCCCFPLLFIRAVSSPVHEIVLQHVSIKMTQTSITA